MQLNNNIESIIQKIKVHYDDNNALLSGNSGILLFDILANRLPANVSNVIEEILYNEPKGSTFCNGKAGINWLFTYLERHYDFISRDLLLKIRSDDEKMKKASLSFLDNMNYDYLHGAIGIAYYLLYDIENIDIAYHKEILSKLDDLYQRNGAFYYVNKYDETPKIKKISLGLAHGLPSIVKYTIECYKKNINVNLAKELATKLIFQIRNFQNSNAYISNFPAIVHIDSVDYDRNSRLAWCYGDLGIAFVLYRAAVILDINEIREYALKILFHAINRKGLEYTNVMDASICHGSSGIAYIYYKLWYYTKNTEFKIASEYWLSQTMNYYDIENNEINFRYYKPINNLTSIDNSLLMGNAGVGLVLYSILTNDFSWDYCLMLND